MDIQGPTFHLERAFRLASFFVIAILITVVGLIGLSAYISEQKTKEIGIRKSNGANTEDILLLFLKNIGVTVLIGFVISCPIAYYISNNWLQNFAYRINLSWFYFVFAGMSTLFIALLTVSWQTWRAARRNPVEALRYE